EEVSLQDSADVRVTALAKPPVDAQRRLEGARLLHVHPDEVADARRMLDELGHIALREFLVDRESEVRELDGDVRLQSLRMDAVEHLAVGGDDGAGLRLVAYTLAEQRRVREETVLVQPPEHRHGIVEGLAGDEPCGAEPEAIPLDEALQPRAVGRREYEAAERAHEPHSCTIRSTSARSSSVSPRSGARTSARIGTPRNPSAAFDAAWKGNRCSWARSAVALSPASGAGLRTSGTTASGKLPARPETAPAAPAASPCTSNASAPMKTSRPSTR